MSEKSTPSTSLLEGPCPYCASTSIVRTQWLCRCDQGHSYPTEEALLRMRADCIPTLSMNCPRCREPAAQVYGTAKKCKNGHAYANGTYVGHCPTCFGLGVSRELLQQGYDSCINGHEYLSTDALSGREAVKRLRLKLAQLEPAEASKLIQGLQALNASLQEQYARVDAENREYAREEHKRKKALKTALKRSKELEQRMSDIIAWLRESGRSPEALAIERGEPWAERRPDGTEAANFMRTWLVWDSYDGSAEHIGELPTTHEAVTAQGALLEYVEDGLGDYVDSRTVDDAQRFFVMEMGVVRTFRLLPDGNVREIVEPKVES